MPKEGWGTKRVCPETGRRFYDLNKEPIISPYTGESYELSFFTGEKSQSSMSDKDDKAMLADVSSNEMSDQVDSLDDSGDNVAMSEELLEDDDDSDETVALEEIADVPAESEDDG